MPGTGQARGHAWEGTLGKATMEAMQGAGAAGVIVTIDVTIKSLTLSLTLSFLTEDFQWVNMHDRS